MAQSLLKLIAFYLPQFHRIPENDKWWGEGFTEWTNTKKAVQLFEGHRQPRIPLNGNYYDLTDIGTLKWQAELMNRYNVYGLCLYHYWFDGKLLLERPMELLLENKDIKMNYCVSWANEPWTRNWDGGNHSVLMPQNYGNREDWGKHFEYLLPFFRDERYIKVDGKPVLLIYVTNHIDCMEEMTGYWQKRAVESGFPGLFIVETLNSKWDQYEPPLINSSGCVEFEPMLTLFGGYTPWEEHQFIGSTHLFSFDYTWRRILDRNSAYEHREKFCGAFMDWDNSSRVGTRASVCTGPTPGKFKVYLRELMKKCIREGNDRFIFINAWNEWAEGAYLEPDEQNGYGWLEAIEGVSRELNLI